MVNGTVEGPIQAEEVILKSQGHVLGDIHHQSLSIEGAPTLMDAHSKGARPWTSSSQTDAGKT